MLPKRHRLPASQVRTVVKKGKQFTSGPLRLMVISMPSGDPQFAFVVSSAVDKRATVRNRMKRVLRAAVSSFLSEMYPCHAVFVVRPSGDQKNNRAVTTHARELLQRAFAPQ